MSNGPAKPRKSSARSKSAPLADAVVDAIDPIPPTVELDVADDRPVDRDAPTAGAGRALREKDASGDMAELAACDMGAFFGPEGPLAGLLEGYEPRHSQVEMARAIQEALLARKHTLVEAPTGTGKTIAYLVPALLSGRTVVIATANKSLQNQLYTKDIPFLRKALGREIDAVLVKGRSNYLCTLKWENELEEQQLFARIDREHDAIPVVREWLERTETGDVDELPVVLDADLRPRVVSFPDDCLQRDCPHFDDGCWVNLMRDHAAQADVIITNHHLLLNALELGVAGERLLPPASVYIVDEAHGLEQTATAVYETLITDYTVEQLLARKVLKQNVEEEVLSELGFQNALAFQEVEIRSRDNSFVLEGRLRGIAQTGPRRQGSGRQTPTTGAGPGIGPNVSE